MTYLRNSEGFAGQWVPKRGWRLAFTLAIPVIGGLSCSHGGRKTPPAQDPMTLDDTTFLHHLRSLPVVTVDEGMRAVLLLRGPTSDWPTFESRCAELERLGAIRRNWNLRADGLLDHGTLAYMVRRLAQLPPGINDRIASWTGLGERRYALKTCIHEGVVPYAVARDRVSGAELLATLAQIETRVTSSIGSDNRAEP